MPRLQRFLFGLRTEHTDGVPTRWLSIIKIDFSGKRTMRGMCHRVYV